MAFCTKSKQMVSDNFTVVENRFLLTFMPDAPEIVCRVYLLGLALSGEEGSENTVDAMAKKLSLTPEDVLAAYDYWEELGLVQVIASDPPQIVYLPVTATGAAKKINTHKYAAFSKEMQRILTGRMITVSEYAEYYSFLENNLFEWEALIAVAKYCVEHKGDDISCHYILTVAYSQLKKGAVTAEAVTDNLSSYGKHDADLKMVFKVLKLSRKTEYGDREMFEKWLDFGFTLDVVLQVAKKVKTGGMKKLDALLEEFYRKGALDIREIEAYEEEKETLFALAKDICRNLGVYYQSLDVVVDEYVCKWRRMGFDDALPVLAKYCFRNNIRTLGGMDAAIEKFYRLGLTSQQSIDEYIRSVVETDKKLRKILDEAGLSRNVTASDRKLYRIWTEKWGFSQELMEFAAEKSLGANNAMQYLNKVLSGYLAVGITTVEQAKRSAATVAQPAPQQHSFGQHEYTDSELNALFTNLDTED